MTDQHPGMTEETRAFFAAPANKALMEKFVAAYGAPVRFIRYDHDLCAVSDCGELAVSIYCARTAAGHLRGGSHRDLDGRNWWDDALREGRALIEDSRPAAAAGGSTREDEQGSDSPCSPPAPLRSTCACGQTVWRNSLDYDGSPICSDCVGDKTIALMGVAEPEALDTRIAAARKAEADPTSDWSAWSHPAAEGEAW